MSKVTVLNVSHEKPLSFIGSVAGISHGHNDDSKQRALRCWKAGHTSVLEHVTATFHIEGISRACSHQLVRHRMASFVQESQRYMRIDTDNPELGNLWFVTPPNVKIDRPVHRAFVEHMVECGHLYQDLLKSGVKPEDARYVLPEACTTNINMTMNIRELESFYRLRADRSAQWEIRNLAGEIMNELSFTGGNEWEEVCRMIEQRAKDDDIR